MIGKDTIALSRITPRRRSTSSSAAGCDRTRGDRRGPGSCRTVPHGAGQPRGQAGRRRQATLHRLQEPHRGEEGCRRPRSDPGEVARKARPRPQERSCATQGFKRFLEIDKGAVSIDRDAVERDASARRQVRASQQHRAAHHETSRSRTRASGAWSARSVRPRARSTSRPVYPPSRRHDRRAHRRLLPRVATRGRSAASARCSGSGDPLARPHARPGPSQGGRGRGRRAALPLAHRYARELYGSVRRGGRPSTTRSGADRRTRRSADGRGVVPRAQRLPSSARNHDHLETQVSKISHADPARTTWRLGVVAQRRLPRSRRSIAVRGRATSSTSGPPYGARRVRRSCAPGRGVPSGATEPGLFTGGVRGRLRGAGHDQRPDTLGQRQMGLRAW